jgi:hypothetical protein
MRMERKMASLEEMYYDPNYESMSCQLNCGFVLFFPRGDDGFEVWNRMILHKARGCEKDAKYIRKDQS